MANINLDPSVLLAQSAEMENLGKEYEALFSSVGSVLNQTNNNWSPNLAHNFSGKIASAQKGFSEVVDMLGYGASAAKASAERFQSIDSQLAKVLGGALSAKNNVQSHAAGMGIGISGVETGSLAAAASGLAKKPAGNLKSSWWDKIHTGKAKVVSLTQKAISSAMKNYQEKGTVWKVVETGKAVVTTISAVTSAVAAWGLTAGTAGLSTPLASLVTLHSANSVANSFADIYNCWFGNKKQVGEVNYLESFDKNVFGDLVGGAIYNGASVASTVSNISNLIHSVTNATDIADAAKGAGKELHKVKDGVAGIAQDVLSRKTPLSHARIQFNLLLKDMEQAKGLRHIKDLKECAGILNDVRKTTKEIGDAVVKTIYEAINPGEKYDSSFAKWILGEDSPVISTYDTYQDMKDAKSAFSKDTFSDLKDIFLADSIQY